MLNETLNKVADLGKAMAENAEKISGFSKRLAKFERSPLTKHSQVNDAKDNHNENDSTDWSGDLNEATR